MAVQHVRRRRGVGELRRGARDHLGPVGGGRTDRRRSASFVRRGESVRVDVVVRTRNVGHFFPGGTVDAFDVWVELEAVDDRGQVLLHSGFVEDGGRGPVDPSAHVYRSLMLDERGNPINKRNAWATRSVAYVRLIPPGAADTVHYRLAVPQNAGDRITLTARVNHRKFSWWNTQWSFAGERDPKHAFAGRRAELRRREVGVHGEHGSGVGAAEGDPRPADHRHGRGDGDAERRHAGRAARLRPRRSRRCGDAGTTTASACCCRAT